MSAARLHAWRMREPGKPLVLEEAPLPVPGPGEVVLEVAACGLCHTDFSFLYGGVRPNAPLPLTLGHEIVGRAVVTGAGTEAMAGDTFVVPAVMPCGDCDLCRAGRGNVCRAQKMPGNDLDGGFASHVLTPARFLCPLPEGETELERYAVVADAVSTAYQAVLRSGAGGGDLAIVVGTGGVGTFALQAARHLGARVVALDVDSERLASIASYADLALDAGVMSGGEIRRAVKAFEQEHDMPSYRRRIFECSGSAAGQETAWSLLTHDATLLVIGFTLDKIAFRLSNLMAFDARALGTWGCLPEHYPAIVELVASGALSIGPFVECHAMSRVNELLAAEHHRRRPILIPDF